MQAFAGRSLLAHVLAAVEPIGAADVAVVIGHRRDEVREHLAAIAPAATPVVQERQLGTGHAVRVALEALRPLPADEAGTVVVVPGDAPLLRPATLAALVDGHRGSGASATMLTSIVDDPTGYGRVIRSDDGAVERIVEHKDATPGELAVNEVSALVYAFDEALLREALGALSTDNAQGEEYLPDVVAAFVRDHRAVVAVTAPADETAGINDRAQLAHARRVFNDRLLADHMRNGVTVVDPATAWVDCDVAIEPDATLETNVQLRGATRVGAGSVIGPDTTLTDTTVGFDSVLHRTVANQAVIGDGVTVGPFAYLRPGTVLADQVHVGTYVEIKGSDVGLGTKVPHLTYVGDASIGAGTNIGAATVFVNYDGVAKHRTTIGDHARTGADNMFVAPVSVGDGAYTAAGSIISQDVPPGALGVARARQRNIAGWVLRRRPGSQAAEAAAAAGATADAEPTDDAAGASQAAN